jgi:tRNA threonylcarbamoyladenosine biosynthesis protein TsaB
MILALETSTHSCDVALIDQGKCVARKQAADPQSYLHSEQLHLFIEAVLAEARLKVKDLEAVAVGAGPGSYTGLRIGAAAAKGLCFPYGLPLIAVSGLDSLAHAFAGKVELKPNDRIVPMIDARRMEVYYSLYDAAGTRMQAISALIVEPDSFTDLEGGKYYLIGDGASKCQTVLETSNFVFPDHWHYPSAVALGELAEEKHRLKEWEDLAYFEPFYLKKFFAGKPKKLL